jgi:hypothetical protein
MATKKKTKKKVTKKSTTINPPEEDILEEVITETREHTIQVKPDRIIDFIRETYGIDSKDFLIRIFGRDATRSVELNGKASVTLGWKDTKLVKHGPKRVKKKKVVTRKTQPSS